MITKDNRNYLVVNAFAESAFGGNPAAVFPNACGLSDSEMQLIARQLNLVETVFVFRSEDTAVDRHLRYFTPLKELPIAGHPTIATWIALLHENEIFLTERNTFKQKTQPGIQTIDIKSKNGRTVVSMEQPSPKFLSVEQDKAKIAEVFGVHTQDLMEELPIQAIDTGLGHLIVPIKKLDALMRVQRNIDALRSICAKHHVREAQLFCFETRDPKMDLHTRNLCPREGLEDPACGVGNGALGAYLAHHKYPNEKELNFRAEQGHVVNMPSVIEVKVLSKDGSQRIFIGGGGVVMLKGTFETIS